jgi:CHAD domain-containing protein
VPAELRDASFGLRRRAVLAQVATLRTERHVHRLVDEDGTALAEIVVDEVTADTSPGWREVEVELIDGDADLLKRAGKWLVKNGATPSASASKLARALGVEATPAPDTRTLAGLVADYLDRQRAEIVRHDVDLRRGGDEIRSMRIATRRYRSVLRLLRDILDRERAERLDAELRWIAGLLGEVRDRQVLRERLAQLLEGLPDELFRGRVTAHVRAVLDQEKAQAEAALADAMRSRRYLHLLAELTAWHEQLPIDSDAPATEVARYLDDAERTVAKRSRKVPKSGDGRDEALHKVRKAAKRARYLAELSKPALGRPAKTARRRNKEIQKRLGERQDVVVTLAFLLRTGIGMDVDAFALGVLYDQARSGRIS